MSATSGRVERRTRSFSASPARLSGTATRAISQPASWSCSIWRSVAGRSCVRVVHIDCTAIGAPSPIAVPPTQTRFDLRRGRGPTRSSGRFRSMDMGVLMAQVYGRTRLCKSSLVRRFARGASIVWRSVDVAAARVQTVWPWTVVRDDGDGIVLYMPAGTVGKQRTGERGGPRDRMLLRWDGGHRDVTWKSTSVVRLYREGDDYSIWIARDATSGEVVWRYINLEDPWRRTAIGFDSKDRWLDLAADPGGEWRWKDEDEMEWLVA